MNNLLIKILNVSVTALVSTTLFAQTQLEKSLRSIDSVKEVEKLESPVFSEKYLLRVTRPVNPEAAGEMTPEMQTYVKYADMAARNADAGTFEQRVIVCHVGYDRPTVLVTEGYWATYALNPRYQDEIARLFNTNLVVVEYRYFGESTPNPRDWQYLTVANSLCDLHHVVEMLKPIYTNKWISTGISKGGQTTMFYRSYYPDDVDISVPYVAPLNKSVEDGRHETFLAKEVGTAAQRKIISDYMTRLVKDRKLFVPMFEEFVKGKGYEFRVPVDEIFDLCVAELRYAVWQYGTPVSSIPTAETSDEDAFKFLVRLNDPNYFSLQTPYYSFNVMAVKELGYYGYDIRPFAKYMTLKNTEGYLRRVMLQSPESELKFDDTLYKHVVGFLKENDPKMIYIYGGVDPWGSSGVCTWLDTSKKHNLKVYVKEGASHSARISTFEDARRSEIIGTIQKWLDE